MFSLENILPFGNLTDNQFTVTLNNIQTNNLLINNINSIFEINNKKFDQFCFNMNMETNCNVNCNNDPNLNFFSGDLNITELTEYVLQDDIQSIVSNINNEDLSLCSFNINSVVKNLDEFIHTYMYELKFSIISLVETKLTPDICHLFNIDGYQMYTNCFKRNSGGVSMYVSQEYSNHFERVDLRKTSNHIECLFVEIPIERQSKNILVGVIYHRPNSSEVEFLRDLSDILLTISRENKVIYLTGDFNLNLLKYDCNVTVRNFVDLLHGYNLLSLVNKPTRVTDTTVSIIDHIWSSSYQSLTKSFILYSSITDHFPICSCFKINKNNEENNKTNFIEVKYRKYSEAKIDDFKKDICEVDWGLVLDCSDSDLAFNNFFQTFNSIFNFYFPLESKKVKKKYISNKFLNDEIKNLIKEKNKMQRKFSKKPLTYGEEYRKLRNKINKLVRKAKNNYYRNKLNDAVGDSMGTWSVINEILHRPKINKTSSKFNVNGNVISNDKDVANHFNNHFISTGEMLAEGVSGGEVSYDYFLNEYNESNFNFVPTNQQEIIEITNSLSNTSPGLDDIPVKLIKAVINYIALPLCHIFNTSLGSGIFPNDLKIAKIIPVFKKGDKSDLKNYRPISILSSFSKILEKIVYVRILQHLEHFNIIHESQYGFRCGRSTCDAILQLTDHVLKEFDRKSFTVAVFLDLKKAFETVNHAILLQKLYSIGMSELVVGWFQSYLTGRKQSVKFNDCYSDFKVLNYSVPQGSNLGPLLFLIYINDIVNSLSVLKPILFADDSCFYHSGDNLKHLIDVINIDLLTIHNWIVANKLTLNIDKSHYIVFNRRKKVPPDINKLFIDKKELNKVNYTVFLGVTLCDNLSWYKHINILTNKINKLKGIIYLTRECLTIQSMKTIYYSLVYSNIIYCNVLWGRSPLKHLKALEIAQKSIIRTIMYRNRYHHTNDDFIFLNFLKLKDINVFSACCFVYRSVNSLALPVNYYHFIDDNQQNYNTRILNQLNLCIPFAGSTQGQTSPSYYACHFWNCLPLEIKSKPSLFSFKKSLKDSLINSYRS